MAIKTTLKISLTINKYKIKTNNKRDHTGNRCLHFRVFFLFRDHRMEENQSKLKDSHLVLDLSFCV